VYSRRARKQTVRIGSGAGFQGDRLEPAVILTAQGAIDYLVLECLAERTIALAQLRKLADPAAAYDPLRERRMRSLLAPAKRNGVRIVTNMGAANPLAAGRKVIALARELGVPVKVAVVTGDNVLGLLTPDMKTIGARGAALAEYGNLVSANAYLGAEQILPALASGADVVITGRVSNPSLVLAPTVHEFGWALDGWPRLGRGTVIGHLLECAGQATGGYFADPGVKDVPNLAHLGFPWYDVDADGNGVLGKVAGTGGSVTLSTVKEQLLYEVTDPTDYVTPDVGADFTGVRVREVGPDRVQVTGGAGRARTGTFKTSVGYFAGYVDEGEISYAGGRARERASLAGEALRERLQEVVPDLRIEYIGVDSIHHSNFGHPTRPTRCVCAPWRARPRASSRRRSATKLRRWRRMARRAAAASASSSTSASASSRRCSTAAA
jgi:hypothetical protein